MVPMGEGTDGGDPAPGMLQTIMPSRSSAISAMVSTSVLTRIIGLAHGIL